MSSSRSPPRPSACASASWTTTSASGSRSCATPGSRRNLAPVNKLLPRILIGVAAGVAVYVGFTVWADARNVGRALASFAWTAALAGVGLALCNYLVRFLRWHYYLRVLGLEVPAGESLLVFLGGFALTVTPGKLGEAVKAFLLRESRGIPATRTAPIVLAERFTHLVGLLLLAGGGVFPLPPGSPLFSGGG